MDNLSYLVVAYSIIFIVIFLYVVFLWRRQGRLNDEMLAIEAKLAQLQAELVRSESAPNRSSGH
jgi:CcmD family protein